MNDAFRRYAFGTMFNLNLRENAIQALAVLCQGDELASIGLSAHRTALFQLQRRGLAESHFNNSAAGFYWRPTKAGMLVYDLLVEAGAYEAVQNQRRATLEAEWKLDAEEWEQRSAKVVIRLKDRFLFNPTWPGRDKTEEPISDLIKLRD